MPQNVLGVIPARYGSKRFPGKPLIDIAGKSMIQRVYQRALKATSLHELVVATDDERIRQAVLAFGGKVVMTAASHRNGTERCQEVSELFPEAQVLINIQGDEPFIEPAQIDELVDLFLDETTQIGTLAKVIEEPGEIFDESEAKVVFSQEQKALYFSRAPIPHLRGIDPKKEDWRQHYTFYKHIGMYGYRNSVLQEIVKLPPTPLEEAEKLEQLRWLDSFTIKVGLTATESFSIDTPKDLTELLAWMERQGLS